MKPENRNILRVLELTKEMLAVADKGDRDRKDNGCGIMYGILRDYSYKLKSLAEEEIEKHLAKGSWDGGETGLFDEKINEDKKING